MSLYCLTTPGSAVTDLITTQVTSLSLVAIELGGTRLYNLRMFWNPGYTIIDVVAKMGAYNPPTLSPLCTPPATGAPTCTACPANYFLSNQRCTPCHWACQGCSGPTNAACYQCSAGYYTHPGKGSLCIDSCPTGYTPVGQTCVLNSNPQLDIAFSNNLLGDFNLPSGLHVQLGWDPSRFYPDFDFLDPIPVRYRGLFFNISESISLPSFTYNPSTLVLSSDFTVDMWVLPYDYGQLFRVNTNNGFEDDDLLVFGISQTYVNWPYPETHNILSLGMKTYGHNFQFLYTDLEVPTVKTTWYHVGFSARYYSANDTTVVTLFVNEKWQRVTFPSLFVDYKEARHNIGFLCRYIAGYLGYIYGVSIVNVAKSMTEIAQKRGSCSDCAVCPLSTSSCLSTCKFTEYVDSQGNCKSCPVTCKYGCTRPETCNLCDDSLCYKCSTFDPNTCIVCYPGASFVNGKCQCDPGLFLNGQKCSATCDPGFYLDSTVEICLACEPGCQKCTSTECIECNPDLFVENGHCSCGEGWLVSSSGECVRCDAVCKSCYGSEASCTECYTEYGYYLQGNVCVDCRTTPGYDGGLGKENVVTAGLTAEQAANAVCHEICGDAISFGQYPCDDGNLSDGDGCSSTCEVEHGWDCVNLPGLPSACKDDKAPEALLEYVKKTDTGYELIYSFSEVVYFTQDINDLASVDISKITLFTYDFTPMTTASSLYSPYLLTITPSQTVKKGSTVTVRIRDTSQVTDKVGNRLVTEKVATEVEDEFLTSTSQQVATGVAGLGGFIGGLLGLSIITTLFGGGGLGPLWRLIEHCQIINFIIYMSLSFPDNLRAFLHGLDFSNFAIVPNFYSDYVSDVFPSPSTAFENEGRSSDFYINCGGIVVIAVVLILLFAVVEVTGRLRPDAKDLQRWRRLFKYSVPIRFSIETYLMLSLGVFLQLREPVPGEGRGYLSVISAFLVLGYLVFTYFLTLWKVTFQSLAKLKEKKHMRQFGSLYQEFREERKSARAFLIVQHLRRLLYVLGLVFAIQSGMTQGILLTLMTFGFAAYLLFLRPYKNLWLGNRFECVSEILLSVAMIMVSVLALDLTRDSRELIGWGIIAVLSASIALHVGATIVMQYREIVNLTRRCARRMVKRAAERQRKKILSGKEPTQAWHFSNESMSNLDPSGGIQNIPELAVVPVTQISDNRLEPVEEEPESALGEIRPVRE